MIFHHLLAVLLGFCLDLCLGDPRWFPHPVCVIGNLIAKLEKFLRKIFKKSNQGEFFAGIILAIFVILISGGVTWLILWICGQISVWLEFLIETWLCYQILATKSLKDESKKVYHVLKTGDLIEARFALSMIVGRDTENLDKTAITKATVETIAENTTDGVVAPLIFLALGGAPLGMAYKAVNTLDSMIGYQNSKYLYFGRFSAKLDDILNFIPARISGLLMCISAGLTGLNYQNALKIFLRDRKNHKSPNSAHTEAACAGALGIQLAGSSYYFGKLVEKPTIGDDLREIAPEDILGAHRLLYSTAILSALLFCGIPLGILILILI